MPTGNGYYECDHFGIEELVGPRFLAHYSPRILWSRFHFLHLMELDATRREFGRIVINGTFNGVTFTESGARWWGTRTGAALSLHFLFGAFDMKFLDASPIEVQRAIVSNPSKWRVWGRLENAMVTKTWLHGDFGNRLPEGGVYVFNP